MPLYRVLRRVLGNKQKAFSVVMALSGVLHMGLCLLLGIVLRKNVWPVIIFLLVAFGILTILAYCTTKQKSSDAKNE